MWLFCSTASLWEIAIKAGLRRQNFEVDIPALRAALAEIGNRRVAGLGSHAEPVSLPAIHKDPFDRMLMAQSMPAPLVLLTNERFLPSTGTVRNWRESGAC